MPQCQGAGPYTREKVNDKPGPYIVENGQCIEAQPDWESSGRSRGLGAGFVGTWGAPIALFVVFMT